MRSWAFASALLLATPAAAQKVQPPATMDAKGVDAWLRTYIQADGWTLIHADGEAVSYARGTDGLKADENGLLRAEVRREYYKPVRMGPSASRSNYQTWLLDCDLRRYRVTAMSFYQQNNLKGSGFRKTAEAPAWINLGEGSAESPVFDRICASAPAKTP